MDFLGKIFSNSSQPLKEDQQLSHLIKNAISGNSSEISPISLYKLNSFCQTNENSSKVMQCFSNAIDQNCESPMPIFKTLKLILLLSKLSPQTFTPAARNFAPEIQTIIHVSFDKPGLSHVNTIHKYANVLYLHLVKNTPLPDMKIPPPPKQQPLQSQGHSQDQRQPQRPGLSPLENEGESLFDSNDNFDNNDDSKHENSGSFLSNLMDLAPKRRPQQQANQQPPKGSNSQNQEGPRLPAVFASGGAFQGVRSRISQPLDFGYEDENEAESLLNFGNDNNELNNGVNEDLLIGAFDDIESQPKNNKSPTNNNSNSIDQTDFIFSGAEPATSNLSTDINAPFNPFGADGFNPTFPDVNGYKNNDDTDETTNAYRRPFVASGPKPKFDPSKMKKKPKIVPNTVPQDNFDPFGTGSASNAFDNIPKEPPRKPSLAERLGQTHKILNDPEEHQKKPQQPGKNVFDLLGDDVFGNDGNEEPESTITTSASKQQVSQDTKNQKGSKDAFDALGDNDFGSFEAVPTNEKTKVASNEELFEPFGSSPQLSQAIVQNQQSKNGSVNVFDVLGDDAFDKIEKEPQNKASSKNGMVESLYTQNQEEQIPQQKTTSANVFDILGDDVFSTPSNSTTIQSSEEHPVPSSDDLFEPFNPSNSQQNQSNSKEELFEPISSSVLQQNQKQSEENLFEPIYPATQQQKTQSKEDLFEPFESSPQKQQQQQQPQKSTGNVFDMLDDNSFTSPAPSNQGVQLQPKGSAEDDFFNSFEAAPSSQPPYVQTQKQPSTAQKNSSANVFDMLGDDDFTSQPQTSQPPAQKQQQTNSRDNLFESFSTSTPQQQKTSSKENIFEPFETSAQNQQKTQSKGDLFEPFDSATQNQQQNQKQSPIKSTGNVFDMLDDNSFTSPAPSNQGVQLQPKGSAEDDFFNSFEAAPSSQPPYVQTQKQPSTAQKNSSANVFDMLGDDMFSSGSAPASQQNQPAGSRGGNASNDFFNSFPSVQPSAVPQNDFDNFFGSSDQQQQQPQQKQSQQFGMFESLGKPTQNQQPNNKQSSANLFDMLDSSEVHTTQPPKKGPSKSTNVYDIFG